MDIDNYSKFETKLNTVFEQASKSKDARSFFTYLYNYMDIIVSNPTYEKEVYSSFGLYYSDDTPAFIKDIPDFKTNLRFPTEDFNTKATKWLTSNLTNEKYQTEVYHSWLRIYLYYLLRKSSYEQRNQYKSLLQYKSTSLLLKNEFTNIFKLNTDKKNHVFKTPLYKLSLELFHPVLIEYFDYIRDELSPNSAASNKTQLPQVTHVDSDTKVDIISLQLQGRTLYLVVNKQLTQKVIKFSSKANYNFKAFKELWRQRNKGYLDKDGMGVGGKSKLTDLTKTMNLKGLLGEYIVDYDKTVNRIRLLDNVEIPHENLLNLITFVKDNFQKNSDSSDS